MECLEKLTWNNYTREELERISINSPDEKSEEMVYRNWIRSQSRSTAWENLKH